MDNVIHFVELGIFDRRFIFLLRTFNEEKGLLLKNVERVDQKELGR